MKKIRGLRALAAVCGLAACADVGPEVDDLRREIAENRARWVSSRPATYVYEVERLCFCGIEARGPVRVRVQGPSVLERTYTASGSTVSSQFAEFFPTVDGIFDFMEEAVERDAHEVRVDWSEDSGVPREVWVDYMQNVADEEMGYRIVVVPRSP